jgi:hypothetical protein
MTEPVQRRARSDELTHVSDPNNVQLEIVEDPDQEGMSTEDAYRHLAGLAPEPVAEPEE